MGRWQLVQAILLFLGAPLWVGVLVFATLNAATGGGAATPEAWLAALMLACWASLHAPKLLGYAEVLLKPALAARYGGRLAFRCVWSYWLPLRWRLPCWGKPCSTCGQ